MTEALWIFDIKLIKTPNESIHFHVDSNDVCLDFDDMDNDFIIKHCFLIITLEQISIKYSLILTFDLKYLSL